MTVIVKSHDGHAYSIDSVQADLFSVDAIGHLVCKDSHSGREVAVFAPGTWTNAHMELEEDA